MASHSGASRSVSSRGNVFELRPADGDVNYGRGPDPAFASRTAGDSGIRAVWAATLEEEVAKIQDLVEEYHFVAVEVRSPGILARPTHPSDTYLEHNYKLLKCNVDLLKVTQIELTFSDAKGNLPRDIATWQFNFSFNLHRDMYSRETLTELQNCGVAVDRLHEHGIDPAIFGEVLTSSGLVLNDQIQWVSVIGCAQSFSSKWGERGSVLSIPDPEGDVDFLDCDTVNQNGYLAYANPLLAYAGIYDFAVLLSLLTGKPLPDTVEGFCEAMQLYYPKVCLRRPRLSHEELACQSTSNCGDDHRRNAQRRIHCLRNVSHPSTFAYHALEEWFSSPDKLGWGMIAPCYARSKSHSD